MGQRLGLRELPTNAKGCGLHPKGRQLVFSREGAVVRFSSGEDPSDCKPGVHPKPSERGRRVRSSLQNPGRHGETQAKDVARDSGGRGMARKASRWSAGRDLTNAQRMGLEKPLKAPRFPPGTPCG